MTAGLRIEGLSIARGGRTLVDALDLEVAPGSVLAVTGQAGSGKSTLLAALAGLVPPDTGRVLLDGTAPDPGRAGVVTQEHVLLGGLTAAENVIGRVLARRRLRDGDWPAVLQLLGRLGLPESSHHNLLEQLSGGQQQRVAVARALVDDPPLLVLDDPTSELDASTADLVWNEVMAAVARGAVAVVAFPDGSGGPTGNQQVRL